MSDPAKPAGLDLTALAMGVGFALIWSSAFTSARIIVAAAPPLSALTLRFLISGLIGIALARALGQSWRLTPQQWRATLIFGLCQNALYLGLNFYAMQWIQAGLASIIASTLPLIVALSGWLTRGTRVSAMATTGLVAGFGGVLLILGSRIQGGADPAGIGLLLLGALALAVATLSVRVASSGGGVLMIVGLQMLVGAVVLAPFALAEPHRVALTPQVTLAFAYTVVAPGLFATWLWFLLVNRIGAVRAATFHFLNPVFGVAIAALLLDETLGLLDAVGVAVISVGILLVQRARVSSA